MLNLFKLFAEQIEDTRRYYKAIEELSQLSDRELADIGLYRGEIPIVALNTLNKR